MHRKCNRSFYRYDRFQQDFTKCDLLLFAQALDKSIPDPIFFNQRLQTQKPLLESTVKLLPQYAASGERQPRKVYALTKNRLLIIDIATAIHMVG